MALVRPFFALFEGVSFASAGRQLVVRKGHIVRVY